RLRHRWLEWRHLLALRLLGAEQGTVPVQLLLHVDRRHWLPVWLTGAIMTPSTPSIPAKTTTKTVAHVEQPASASPRAEPVSAIAAVGMMLLILAVCALGLFLAVKVLGALGRLFAPARCDLCATQLHRKRYTGTLNGKAVVLCPKCAHRLEAENSRQA